MPIGGSLTNFPQGFAYGLQVRGMPLLQAQPGNVFWVNNSTTLNQDAIGGSNSNKGTYTAPFSTLQRGFDMCVANRGDIIFVGAGHAETIADASTLAFNKAGVAVIGLGSGATRPTFTFTTATTANIPVTAQNISIQNLLFVANFADIASYMTATSTNTPKNFAIANCEFRDNSSILNCLTAFTSNSTDASCDGLSISNSSFLGLGTTAATAFVTLAGNCDRLTISNNYIQTAVAANSALILLSTTSKVLTRVLIDQNKCVFVGANAATGIMMITTATTDTGMVSNNYVTGARALVSAVMITANSGLKFFNNYYNITADQSGILLPVVQT
jgi:hypothetical protein